MAQFLQEPSKNGAARLISTSVEVCEWVAQFPAVWEHLTETAWASGERRVTSTLMVFCEDGLVKLCLHDRSAGKVAWMSGASFTKAFTVMETGLESGSTEWRRDKAVARR